MAEAPSQSRARSGSFSQQLLDMEEVLVSEGALEARVRQLADQINREYKGKSLVVIGILKGAVMFMTDLVKRLHVDSRIEFMAVSSYGSSTVSTGAVKIVMDTRTSIENEHVLVVEDIVDSGYTMRYLKNLLLSRKPASLEICALLQKPSRLKVSPEELGLRYIGFEIPDKWVVGYGMDYDERYRCLPFIGVLKRSVYDATYQPEQVTGGVSQ